MFAKKVVTGLIMTWMNRFDKMPIDPTYASDLYGGDDGFLVCFGQLWDEEVAEVDTNGLEYTDGEVVWTTTGIQRTFGQLLYLIIGLIPQPVMGKS